MAQPIFPDLYDGQPMDVPPMPQHGDQTNGGVWFGETPDCGVVGCDYSWLDQSFGVCETTRLTWHGEYGEWFCPRHYPRIIQIETRHGSRDIEPTAIEGAFAIHPALLTYDDGEEPRHSLDYTITHIATGRELAVYYASVDDALAATRNLIEAYGQLFDGVDKSNRGAELKARFSGDIWWNIRRLLLSHNGKWRARHYPREEQS